MNFGLPPELLALRERASRLADEIAAFEERCEAERGLPAEAVAEIRALLAFGAMPEPAHA